MLPLEGPVTSLDWLETLAVRGVTPGLDRIASLCAALGSPEREFPSVLVAGTNGKGSTAATLESIARSAGLRTGLYTSPHLVSIAERIRIDGVDIALPELEGALDAIRGVMDARPAEPGAAASWFEAFTAAAFRILAAERVDLAILEVGLGGRCDATNLAPAVVSAITPVDVDHAAVLGSTLASIAREKAGILKTGRSAVSAPQRPEALATIRDFAAAVRAPLRVLDPDSIRAVATSLSGTTLDLDSPFGPLRLETPLAGRHQAENVATAVLAADALEEAGFPIDSDAVVRGVSATRWPGRLDRRVAGGRLHLVDGCHNPHGANAAAAFLDEAGLTGSFVLLLGILADKDVAGIVGPLAARARGVVTTAPPGPRGLPAEALADAVRAAAPSVEVAAVGVPANALAEARIAAARLDPPGRPGATPIVVAGSLLLVGEILRELA